MDGTLRVFLIASLTLSWHFIEFIIDMTQPSLLCCSILGIYFMCQSQKSGIYIYIYIYKHCVPLKWQVYYHTKFPCSWIYLGRCIFCVCVCALCHWKLHAKFFYTFLTGKKWYFKAYHGLKDKSWELYWKLPIQAWTIFFSKVWANFAYIS